jgi:hypothetical protein
MYLHYGQPYRGDRQQGSRDDQDDVHGRGICFQPVSDPLPEISLAIRPNKPLRIFFVQVSACTDVMNHKRAKRFVQTKVFLVFS